MESEYDDGYEDFEGNVWDKEPNGMDPYEALEVASNMMDLDWDLCEQARVMAEFISNNDERRIAFEEWVFEEAVHQMEDEKVIDGVEGRG